MKANSRTIVITAVLTAIGTAIVTTWVPGLLSWTIDWIHEKPLLVVEVQSSYVPVLGVDIAVARVDPPEHLGVGQTDSSGIARIKTDKLELIHVTGRLLDNEADLRYAGIHQVVNLSFHLRLETEKFSSSPSVPPWDTKRGMRLDQLATLRTNVFSGQPTQDAILFSLGGFEFDDSSGSSIEEAESMLEFLGARTVFSRDGKSLSGRFGQDEQTEITIWPNSYDVSGQYGIRYGQPDGSYWGSNETLVHVSKKVSD